MKAEGKPEKMAGRPVYHDDATHPLEPNCEIAGRGAESKIEMETPSPKQ